MSETSWAKFFKNPLTMQKKYHANYVVRNFEDTLIFLLQIAKFLTISVFILKILSF